MIFLNGASNRCAKSMLLSQLSIIPCYTPFLFFLSSIFPSFFFLNSRCFYSNYSLVLFFNFSYPPADPYYPAHCHRMLIALILSPSLLVSPCFYEETARKTRNKAFSKRKSEMLSVLETMHTSHKPMLPFLVCL